MHEAQVVQLPEPQQNVLEDSGQVLQPDAPAGQVALHEVQDHQDLVPFLESLDQPDHARQPFRLRQSPKNPENLDFVAEEVAA